MNTSHPTGREDRAYALQLLQRVAGPVLEAGASRTLRCLLPVPPGREEPSRLGPAEAVVRVLSGIAPWLECDHGAPAERALRQAMRTQARAAVLGFVDPDSPDFVSHENGHTHIESAFLGQAMLFAPHSFWGGFSAAEQALIADWMRAATRAHATTFNNHLLFHALAETALARSTGEPWDRLRVDYALRQHEQWYAGDGWYLDGPEFHFDYYNSLIIHPMLLEVAHHMEAERDWKRHAFFQRFLPRAQRHAVTLERMISPEATVPIIGRSFVYRCAIFTLPCYLALRGWLPESLSPGRMRACIMAATRRIMDAPGVFDGRGWLTIGFCGGQDDLGESYIAVSSLYLVSNVFLPLGLPPENPFWAAPGEEWTSQRAYAGLPIPRDSSLSGDILAPHQVQWGVLPWEP